MYLVVIYGGRNRRVVYSQIWEVRDMERREVQRKEGALCTCRENEI
jgi:hypothetical protein